MIEIAPWPCLSIIGFVVYSLWVDEHPQAITWETTALKTDCELQCIYSLSTMIVVSPFSVMGNLPICIPCMDLGSYLRDLPGNNHPTSVTVTYWHLMFVFKTECHLWRDIHVGQTYWWDCLWKWESGWCEIWQGGKLIDVHFIHC